MLISEHVFPGHRTEFVVDLPHAEASIAPAASAWSNSPDWCPMRRGSTPNRPSRLGQRFLTAAALGAVNTANARKPLSRRGRASVLTFFPGWLTSELPLHVIVWQALATLLFVRRGALRSPKGWLGPRPHRCVVVHADPHLEAEHAGRRPSWRTRSSRGSATSWSPGRSPRSTRPTPPLHPQADRRRTGGALEDPVRAGRGTSPTAMPGGATSSTSGAAPTCRSTAGRRSCCTSTAAPGSSATRSSRRCRCSPTWPRTAGCASPSTTASARGRPGPTTSST